MKLAKGLKECKPDFRQPRMLDVHLLPHPNPSGTVNAMRVLGYTWAGVRTSDLKSTARFFAEALGLCISYEGKGLVQFEMPSAWTYFRGPDGYLYEIWQTTRTLKALPKGR